MSTDSRDDILELFDFHHWAGDRLLEAAAPLSTAQLDNPWGGSFGTGRGLLQHMMGAELVWWARWHGRSPKTRPEFPASHSGRDFLGEWRRIKADQNAWLGSLTRDLLQGQLTYVNLKGDRCTYRLAEILLHVVNHGTYHRGQLAQLLRDSGLPAPASDFLVFVDERRKS